MPAPVEPVSQLRKRQLLALTAKTWWRIAIVLVPIAVGALAAAVVSQCAPSASSWRLRQVTAWPGSSGRTSWPTSRARAAFLTAWARTRAGPAGAGPWHGRGDAAPPRRRPARVGQPHTRAARGRRRGGALPLHVRGSARELELERQRARPWESPRVHGRRDGRRRAGHPGLSLHPRSFGDNRVFDRIDSALTPDRVVQLESSELQHEYKLEVADSASDLAVRLLFEPAFIVWCLEQSADEMLVEIENGDARGCDPRSQLRRGSSSTTS